VTCSNLLSNLKCQSLGITELYFSVKTALASAVLSQLHIHRQHIIKFAIQWHRLAKNRRPIPYKLYR